MGTENLFLGEKERWGLPTCHTYCHYGRSDEPLCYFDDSRTFHRLTVMKHPEITRKFNKDLDDYCYGFRKAVTCSIMQIQTG